MRLRLAFISISCLSYGFAATIRVPGDLPTIREAVDAAASGDCVLVAPGEYLIGDPIDFNHHHDPENPESPALKDIALVAEDGPANTALRKVPILGSVLNFHHGESRASLVEGFTIDNGHGDVVDMWETIQEVLERGFGGGISCFNSSPTIKNCIIARNDAASGGGMWVSCRFEGPRVVGCLFSENGAGSGSGIFVRDGFVVMEGCEFLGNFDASAIGIEGPSSMILQGCIIHGNTGGFLGGGVFCNSSLLAVSCVIAGNKAVTPWPEMPACGGGLFAWGGSTTLVNCTIVDNAAMFGAGVFGTNSALITCRNSVLWGNKASEDGDQIALMPYTLDPPMPCSIDVDHCIVEDGQDGAYIGRAGSLAWLDGNSRSDPLIQQQGYWDDRLGTPEEPSDDVWMPGDYHLMQSSPAIGAGVITGAGILDFDGLWRPDSQGVDLGAYESNGEPAPLQIAFNRGDSNVDGVVTISDAVLVLRYMFSAGRTPLCLDAADVNDNGSVDLGDVLLSLSYMFGAHSGFVYRMSGQFVSCEPDHTWDALTCESYPPCRF